MDPTPSNMTVLLEHGGITAVFALGLLWMLQRVGLSLIAAISELRTEITTLAAEIQSHSLADAQVAGRISRLEGVITGRESMTPVEGVPIVASHPPFAPSSPLPGGGEYSLIKPTRAKTDPGKR
jgi:hypothetical protein